MSTLQNAWGDARGRTISITRVENGYVVKARYTVWKKPTIRPQEAYKDEVSKEFVFQNDADAIAFVQSYLTAPKEDIDFTIAGDKDDG